MCDAHHHAVRKNTAAPATRPAASMGGIGTIAGNRLIAATCSLLSAAVITAVIAASPAAARTDEARVRVEVPAQDLGSALVELGRQAGLSLLFDPALVRGKRSRRVYGSLLVSRALDRMLAGTGLTVFHTGNGSLVVVAARQQPPRPQHLRRPREVVPGPPATLGTGLADIIVTAQKKAELLQDLPISIVALDAEDIRRLRIDEIGDIGHAVPNVQMQSHPSGQSSQLIVIRGIGASDNQLTQDPSVAVYVDGVYVARVQDMGRQIVDLERIEVLRGPQGTLYGRNATGGAINFVTRLPEFGAWHIDATATVGAFNERSGSVTVNVPVGGDLAARLTYVATRRDGPVRNRGTGARTFGARHRDTWRADLRWRPDAAWTLRYVFDRSNTADTAFYIQAAPGGSQTQRPDSSSTDVRDFRPSPIDSTGHSLTIDWYAGDRFAIKSISAYRTLDHHSYQDYLSGSFRAKAALIGASDISQQQWSQEAQLLGTAFGDRLDYVAGAYYFAEKAHGLSRATLPPEQTILRSFSRISNRAYALYAQGTMTPRLLDGRLHLTLAGRWSRDERSAVVARGTEALPAGRIVPDNPVQGDRSFDDFSPTLSLAFDITSGTMVYAKRAEGYKTGGFNLRSGTTAAFRRGFNPERVTSYEIGLKSELFERRLRFNMAAFRADYDDIQLTLVNVDDATSSNTINAGSAVIAGVEAELTARPWEALQIGASFAWLNPDYSRIVDADGQDITDAYRFAVPASSFNLQARYRFAQTIVGRPVLDLSYSWQGGHASATTTSRAFSFPAYGLLNARLEMAELPVPGRGGMVALALWARNLADTKYWFINGSLFGGYRAWGEPRTFGADLSWRF